MSTRISSISGRHDAPFFAARWTRCRQQPDMWICSCCFPTKDITPFFHPVTTLALSQPNDKQFFQGILWAANSSSTSLKMFSPRNIHIKNNQKKQKSQRNTNIVTDRRTENKTLISCSSTTNLQIRM